MNVLRRHVGLYGAPTLSLTSSPIRNTAMKVIREISYQDLLVKGGFEFKDVQLFEKSALLPVQDIDEFANAIWSSMCQPAGGWTKEDDDKWNEALAEYKGFLPNEPGYYQLNAHGDIILKATAQIAIVRKA